MASYKETSDVKTVNLSLLASVLPEDHVGYAILRSCERLEQVTSNRQTKFSDQVEVLLSVVESLLTDCLTRLSPAIMTLLFDYLVKHTLFLVFHGDWGENKAMKAHMYSLYNRFKMRAEIKKLSQVVCKVQYLLELIEDPWESCVLIKIFRGENETQDEILDFVKRELGIFLRIRLEVMVYAEFDFQVLVLLEKSLICISIPANSEYFQTFSDEVMYLRDMYLLMLNKAKSDSYTFGKITNEVNKMGLEGCIQFVNRCRNGRLPFEILSNKTADVVINMVLASSVIKDDTDEQLLTRLIDLWSDSLTDSQVLLTLLKHLVRNAVRSRYIFCFGKMLTNRFKLTQKELCVEVYVRALNLNVNEVESCVVTKDRDKVEEYSVQLSNGFLQLGDYLKGDGLWYRELVLAAFSAVPSQSCFERIKACGEETAKPLIENMSVENDELVINQVERVLPDGSVRATVWEHCEEDPPVLTNQGCSSFERELNKSTGNGHCYVETPPCLTAERPDANNIIHGDRNLIAPLENCSEQKLRKEGTVVEENVHCGLSQQIEKLCLQDDSCQNYTSYKDQICDDINKSGAKCRSENLCGNEIKGIPQVLCDDLLTLMSFVRNKDFTWDLEWPELRSRCEHYLLKRTVGKNAERLFTYKSVEFDMSEEEQRRAFCQSTDGLQFNVCNKIPNKSLKRKRKRV